jgi:hypothetical protein
MRSGDQRVCIKFSSIQNFRVSTPQNSRDVRVSARSRWVRGPGLRQQERLRLQGNGREFITGRECDDDLRGSAKFV